MKSKVYLFYFVISVLITSCRFDISRDTDKAIKKFKVSYRFNSYSLQGEIPKTGAITSPQLVNIDGRKTIVFNVNGLHTIYFFDLDSGKIYHKITVPFLYLISFKFFNKDSILTYVSNINFRNGYSDSSLFLCNYTGNIVKYYSLKNPIVWSSKYNHKNDAYYIDIDFNFQFIDKYKIFTPLLHENKIIKLAYFDLVGDSLVVSKFDFNKNFGTSLYYPHEYYAPAYVSEKSGNPVFMLKYSPRIFEWDIKRDTVFCHRITPALIDTVLPLPYKKMAVDVTNVMFSFLEYNPFQKKYYLQADFSEAYNMASDIMILSDNFEILAEELNPKFVVNQQKIFMEDSIIDIFIYSDTLYVSFSGYPELYGTANIDSMKKALDSLYDPKLDPLKAFEQCSIEGNPEILNTNFDEFLEQVLPENTPDSFIVVTAHSSGACPTCYRSLLRFFSLHNSWLADKKDWYFVIVYNEINYVNKTLKYNMLSDCKRIIKVKEKGTEKYFLSGKNPRFTKVVKGKIVLDEIEKEPQGTEQKILKYYGF